MQTFHAFSSRRFCQWAQALGVILAMATGAGSSIAQPNGPVVFVAHNILTNPQTGTYGAISSFRVNTGGTVTWVGNYPTNDYPGALAVSPNGRFLAVTHASSNSVTEDLIIYKIAADASLTMWAVYATPDSPLDVEWVSNTAVACTETRTAGNNKVHVYRFTETNPIPTRLSLIDSEPTGVFTAYLQRNPNGAYLYSSDSDLGGANLLIRTFAINADGTLTFVQDIGTPSYALDMAMTHNGKRLYAAGGIGSLAGGNTHRVHGYVTDPLGGLIQMDASPFTSGGDSPAHVAVTGNDRFLLVGHGGDGDVHSFTISPEDGFLTPTSQMISIGTQGDIGAMTTIDSYLFVTRRYSSTGNPSGLLIYQINSFGQFVPLGGTIDAHGGSCDAIAAWKPTPGIRGDINADGVVDGLDVDAFASVLVDLPQDSSHVARSDINTDGVADGRDIPEFVNIFLHPNEPGACCRPDGTCEQLTETDCLIEGDALWNGPASECSSCPVPPPVIFQVVSDSESYCNGAGWAAFFTVTGLNFAPEARIYMTMPGQPDLPPFFAEVQSSDSILAGFLLEGIEPGLWALTVHNPDEQTATSDQEFLVEFCP